MGSTVDWGCGPFIMSGRENHVENLSQHVKCLRQKNDSKNWGEAGDDGIWSPTSHPVPPVHYLGGLGKLPSLSVHWSACL